MSGLECYSSQGQKKSFPGMFPVSVDEGDKTEERAGVQTGKHFLGLLVFRTTRRQKVSMERQPYVDMPTFWYVSD